VFTLDTFGVLHVIAYKVSPHIAVFVSVSENGILRECTIASTLYADITDAWHQTSLKRPHVMESPPSEVSPDNVSVQGRSQGHHKKRVRVWTEDDRAKHRVFEKGRREAFSDSLLVSGMSSKWRSH
jgi:hypothetical protein